MITDSNLYNLICMSIYFIFYEEYGLYIHTSFLFKKINVFHKYGNLCTNLKKIFYTTLLELQIYIESLILKVARLHVLNCSTNQSTRIHKTA